MSDYRQFILSGCFCVPDVLMLSAEAGVLSLRDKSIPMIQITTVAALSEAYHWITTNPQAKGFKTIFLFFLFYVS